MSANNFTELSRHFGHAIIVAIYGNDDNVAVECVDCFEVLFDYDKEIGE